MGEMIEKWKIKKNTPLNDYKIFSTRRHSAISPFDGKSHDFYVIDSPDWVNIIAVTAKEEIVLIKQFRHGTKEITLEIPGGIIEPEESPLKCAKRELLEETGFTSSQWKRIGGMRPNPAIMSNHCTTFIARDCEKTSETSFDGTEKIETLLMSPQEVRRHLREGTINHCIVVAAFGLYFSD